MAIIIFIGILLVLVLVHEAGHFVVAKLSGMRVDEFGFGYPPRALKLFTWKGTLFSLNWLPFGGFVKIFGENGTDADHDTRSFIHRPRILQAAVLLAGVCMNFVLAWAIISGGLMTGLPTAVDDTHDTTVSNIRLVVTSVSAHSPAQVAGVKPGDVITDASVSWQKLSTLDPDHLRAFVRAVGDTDISMTLARGTTTQTVHMTPVAGIAGGDSKAIGISMELVGFRKVGFITAVCDGFTTAWYNLTDVAATLYGLVHNAIVGHADLSQIAGPVGIVGIVGDAYHIGWVYLLSLAAMISLNLVIINLLPFPALDGGRLLIVIIEAITRRPMPAKVTNWINTIGFGLLILIMLFVTYHDVVKIIK